MVKRELYVISVLGGGFSLSKSYIWSRVLFGCDTFLEETTGWNNAANNKTLSLSRYQLFTLIESTRTSVFLLLLVHSALSSKTPSQSWKMGICTEPGSAGDFILLKVQFFLWTCMLGVRDWCRVDNATEAIVYCCSVLTPMTVLRPKTWCDQMVFLDWND